MTSRYSATDRENKVNTINDEITKTTITLSLDSDILDDLKREAPKESTSVSGYVTQILSKHVLLNRFARDLHAIFITSKTFATIVDKIDENLLAKDFEENALDFIPTIFHSKNIPFTMENLIRYALSSTAIDGGIYDHFHSYHDSEGRLNLVMRHNFGIKWSHVLGSGHVKLIQNMLALNSTFKALPSSVIIKVE